MADNLKVVHCKTNGYEPNEDGDFCCDYEGCGYMTDSRAKLGHHLRYHRKNKHVKLSGEKSISAKSVPRYEKHGGKWRCKVCGKEFDRKRACAAHLGFHSVKNGEFKCQACGRVFTRANALASHLRVHRKKDKPRKSEDSSILPMALEIEGGSSEQTFEVPIVVKIRISVEAK